MTTTATLLLAAGGSTRFGACKLLTEIGGRTLLEHTLAIATRHNPGGVRVVVGNQAERLRARCGEATVVVNAHWRDGLSSSIGAGLHALTDECERVLILLADQPALAVQDLQRLQAAHADDALPTCARYAGHIGVPAIFPRSWFPQLLALRGDHGARALLHAAQPAPRSIEIASAAIDIDTPADLARWQSGAG